MQNENTEDFYNRLKLQLEEHSTWPSTYLYKFIVPTNPEKVQQIGSIFNNTGAVIESKQSKKGTYTSISVTVQMASAEAVIAKYKEVAIIKGVISL